jgi:hypothetical protein
MEYFGSAILMAVVSSVLFVLADSPKIIGPSLSSCMTTPAVPILMISFFVVLSVAGICPCRIGRPLRSSSLAILLGLCLVTKLSGPQSVLYWRCQPIEYGCLGVPPKRGTVASQMDMVACSTFGSGYMVVVCMYMDMA